MSTPTVHVVHCIDTEGPLHESLSATFERLNGIFGVRLPPDRDTLRLLQKRGVDLGGLEDAVACAFAPHLLEYNDSWDKVDAMLDRIMAPAFRNALPDSFGGGWVYNWHCVDHVGYRTNPRRRDMGFHNIFDHYHERVRAPGSERDALYFHHHPLPWSGAANANATHYFAHTPIVFEILARRIIDRGWFPCANRPGFHVTRPDSHWLMEQFIPFDYANQATDDDAQGQKDMEQGRYGDWRRAPRSWTPYHPAHDDYQSEGSCRRWIARCLNVGTRLRLLTEKDVEQAFEEAAMGRPTVLSVTNHDFRDMGPDIDGVRTLLARVSRRYPGVAFRYCDAREAMRLSLNLEPSPPLELTLSLKAGRLSVRANHATFGPQPFLALKTLNGQYQHDNLDIHEPFRSWSYMLDEATFPPHALSAIGVGACDAFGNTAVSVMAPVPGPVAETRF